MLEFVETGRILRWYLAKDTSVTRVTVAAATQCEADAAKQLFFAEGLCQIANNPGVKCPLPAAVTWMGSDQNCWDAFGQSRDFLV